MDLLDQLAEVVRETLARPPRAVRLLPSVVDLEQVEAGPVTEALAEQPRVLEQAPGADPRRGSGTRTPSRAAGGPFQARPGRSAATVSVATSGSACAAMATGSETTSVPAGTAIVVSGGTFSWPQVPSTRWWVGVGSDATTTVAVWHTTRVVNRSLVSAWNAERAGGRGERGVPVRVRRIGRRGEPLRTTRSRSRSRACARAPG